MSDIQVDAEGRLRHFITIDGLSRDLLTQVLDTAESMRAAASQSVRKLPLLRGRTVMNLFFEASTRTRTAFELAATRLSADVVNLDVVGSSTAKGESLLDTLHTLEAMHCDVFIVRHQLPGAAHFIARRVRPGVAVLNGGDGAHSHPTQAMLDVFTLRRHKPDLGSLKVAIVGDILHSRVARSEILAMRALGVGEIRVCGPATLLPPGIEDFGVIVHRRMDKAIADVDAIVMLRLQTERMAGPYLPSRSEFYRRFGLSAERLARAHPECMVMHPGPMNRGVEIASEVADGAQSVVLEQVSNGVAVRMAIMAMIVGAHQGGDT